MNRGFRMKWWYIPLALIALRFILAMAEELPASKAGSGVQGGPTSDLEDAAVFAGLVALVTLFLWALPRRSRVRAVNTTGVSAVQGTLVRPERNSRSVTTDADPTSALPLREFAQLRVDFHIVPEYSDSADDLRLTYAGTTCITWRLYERPHVAMEDTASIQLSGGQTRIAHAALHYGRVLAVWAGDDGRGREKVFAQVGRSAARVLKRKAAAPMEFDYWEEEGPGGAQVVLWPWRTVSDRRAESADVTYLSTLHQDPHGHLWSKLDLPLLGSQFLPAVSALATLRQLSLDLTQAERRVLARVLLRMNESYGTADSASSTWGTRLAGEMREESALLAALPVLLDAS